MTRAVPVLSDSLGQPAAPDAAFLRISREFYHESRDRESIHRDSIIEFVRRVKNNV